MTTIANQLANISDGYDGLIRKIEFSSFNAVTITISAICKASGEWTNVTFRLRELLEFAVKQSLHSSNTVLTHGIFYQNIDGIHCIDFSPYSELMENIEDIRMSDIYFTARYIDIEFRPYAE